MGSLSLVETAFVVLTLGGALGLVIAGAILVARQRGERACALRQAEAQAAADAAEAKRRRAEAATEPMAIRVPSRFQVVAASPWQPPDGDDTERTSVPPAEHVVPSDGPTQIALMRPVRPEAITQAIHDPAGAARAAWEARQAQQALVERWATPLDGVPVAPVDGDGWPHPHALTAIFDAVIGPRRVLVTLEKRTDQHGDRHVYVVRARAPGEGEGWSLNRAAYLSGADLLADVRALADLWRRCPGLIPK